MVLLQAISSALLDSVSNPLHQKIPLSLLTINPVLFCIFINLHKFSTRKLNFSAKFIKVFLSKKFFFQNSILAKHVTVSTFLASKFFIRTMYVADSSGSESYNQFVVDLKQQIDTSQATIVEESSNQSLNKPIVVNKISEPSSSAQLKHVRKGGKKKIQNTTKDILEDIKSGYETPEEVENLGKKDEIA